MSNFWTKSLASASMDPKRQFRFKIMFTNMSNGEPIVWWAKKVSKPNYTVAESKHVFINHTFYWPGRVEWQTISMTLVDPVSPGAVHRINKMIETSGYKIPGSSAGPFETMSKGKASEALGEVEIIQMDSNDNAIETWILKNPFIKMAKFGDLAYDNDDLVEIELELRYDWATCSFAGGADGEAENGADGAHFSLTGPS